MHDHEFMERARARLGAWTQEETAGIVRATLYALGESVSARLADAIASELPAGAARSVRAARRHSLGRSAEAFFGVVARHAQLPLGRAAETAEVVCTLVGQLLSPGAAALAAHQLEPSLAALLAPPPRPSSVPSHRRPTPSARKLSSGRPGPAHPIASSRPPAPLAHEHRLATSHGTRQEEAHETLASARPRSAR